MTYVRKVGKLILPRTSCFYLISASCQLRITVDQQFSFLQNFKLNIQYQISLKSTEILIMYFMLCLCKECIKVNAKNWIIGLLLINHDRMQSSCTGNYYYNDLKGSSDFYYEIYGNFICLYRMLWSSG
jgi:hypothetical protein